MHPYVGRAPRRRSLMWVLLALLAGAMVIVAAYQLRNARGASSVPQEPATRATNDSKASTVGWLRVRVPAAWSLRSSPGAFVVATPVAPGWSRDVSFTTAPFELPADLGYYEAQPSIPSGNYQIWISALRETRAGAHRGPVRLVLTMNDRVASPLPPDVDVQFVRTKRIEDRMITATLSLDRKADLAAALRSANSILRTLEMIE
jgi:hypothetical protein